KNTFQTQINFRVPIFMVLFNLQSAFCAGFPGFFRPVFPSALLEYHAASRLSTPFLKKIRFFSSFTLCICLLECFAFYAP
ncbi:MAG: hypothetical protein II028_08660, partial [Clostridia bacterium]|nr:hypothetical protein [Clostridia bacterium]